MLEKRRGRGGEHEALFSDEVLVLQLDGKALVCQCAIPHAVCLKALPLPLLEKSLHFRKGPAPERQGGLLIIVLCASDERVRGRGERGERSRRTTSPIKTILSPRTMYSPRGSSPYSFPTYIRSMAFCRMTLAARTSRQSRARASRRRRGAPN